MCFKWEKMEYESSKSFPPFKPVSGKRINVYNIMWIVLDVCIKVFNSIQQYDGDIECMCCLSNVIYLIVTDAHKIESRSDECGGEYNFLCITKRIYGSEFI